MRGAGMKTILAGGLSVLAVMALAGAARAAEPVVARVVAALMLPADAPFTNGDWEMLEAARDVEWERLPPAALDSPPSPFPYIRAGRFYEGTTEWGVVAYGARTMVQEVSLAPVATGAPDADAMTLFTAHGFTATLLRCDSFGAATLRERLYRLEKPGRKPAFLLHVFSCGAGECSDSFTLIIADDLPALAASRPLDGECRAQ